MNKSIRFTGLCISLLVFVALLVCVFLFDAKAQSEPIKCPCPFEQIPKTQECWTQPYPNPPLYTDAVAPPPDVPDRLCLLLNVDPEPPDQFTSLDVIQGASPERSSSCKLEYTSEACGPAPKSVFHNNLTPEELKACQCELLAYVTSLYGTGIMVTGGPPYTCGNVDCSASQSSPIPTQSEWGLIALAGALGIVGFMVIRRRKTTA